MDVEILRDARQRAGLTQEELAFRADISDRYMRKIEGGSPPSGKVLRSILAVLNEHDVDVSVDDVLPSRHVDGRSKVAEDKRLLTRWFQRVWNEQDLSAMDEMMHEDCLLTAEGAVARGREEIRTRVAAIQLAFDSFDFQIETMVSDGQWLVAHWVVTKRHVGEFLGIAPTGKTVTVRGNSSVRMKDGQIIEGRDHWDIQPMLDLLAQEHKSQRGPSISTDRCEDA